MWRFGELRRRACSRDPAAFTHRPRNPVIFFLPADSVAPRRSRASLLFSFRASLLRWLQARAGNVASNHRCITIPHKCRSSRRALPPAACSRFLDSFRCSRSARSRAGLFFLLPLLLFFFSFPFFLPHPRSTFADKIELALPRDHARPGNYAAKYGGSSLTPSWRKNLRLRIAAGIGRGVAAPNT